MSEYEQKRLAVLNDYLAEDFLSESVCQRITSAVARLFGVPFACISIVDSDKELVKVAYGGTLSEVPREFSFAAAAILSGEGLLVPDALEDARFHSSPLVTGSPGIRFYAGAPLRTPDGFHLGALTVMDVEPRRLDVEQQTALADLAAFIMSQWALRLSVARAVNTEDESEEHYRELIENANDIVYTHDLQGNFTSVNKAAQQITGYSREEALRMNISEIMEPDSLRLVREMIRRKLGGSSPTTYEVAIITKDCRRLMLEVSTRLLFRKGTPVGVQGIARDISERKRAEAQLRLLKSVVVNSNDGVMVAEARTDDPLGSRIVYVNEAFTWITGYPEEDLIGQTPRMLHGPKTDRLELDKIRRAVQNWDPVRVEIIQYRRDGSEIWVDLNVVPIQDEPGPFAYWVAVVRETTAQKLNELLESDRNHVLEMVAGNRPLAGVLERLALLVERQVAEVVCTVLLARDGRLRHGSAPSLPPGYASAFDGVPVAPENGPTGAAFWSRRVSVTGIADEPAFRPQLNLLLAHGLRSCWSIPVLSGEGKVLGVLAVYSRESREPSSAELELFETACRLAAVAIEQRQLTDQLAHQARHDVLTGLPNRFLFEDRLHQALEHARRHGWLVAVLFIDLDRFKQINDTLGHSVGDALLRQVSRRLERSLRKSDSLARMGGDEFTLVLSELADPQDALRVAQKLLDALRDPFKVDAYELFVTASIGISVYPRDGKDAATLQRNADTAMYRAKNRGKNNFQFFTPELGVGLFEQLEIENALRRAMEHGELQLYYQPQMDREGTLAGLEALLVWNHPKLGLIPPAQFIPVAEESGMIVPIGAWVLAEACHQTAAWRQAGYRTVKVAVNVSSMQFARADFVETVAQAVAQCGLDPSLLTLELTESVVMRDVEESIRQMERLRALGVSISIDDFGTGYSSLSYLRRLPIDTLKIDQSFLKELELDSGTMPLVKAIVELAHGMGLLVVAEGVEDRRQLEALLAVGCDIVQGFLLGEPRAPAEVAQLLSRPQLV